MISPTFTDQIALLRILDAAANRAREGLRVIEDWSLICPGRYPSDRILETNPSRSGGRFGRHSRQQRLAARETQADVGTGITTYSEQTREKLDDVLTANFCVFKKVFVSLEEFGKIIDPAIGQSIEQLRYRTYTIQRAIDSTRTGLARLATARLHILLDGRTSVAEFERMAEILIGAGVDIIQLRDKHLPDRELIDRARRLRRLTCGTATLLIVNDRPDLAALRRPMACMSGRRSLR